MALKTILNSPAIILTRRISCDCSYPKAPVLSSSDHPAIQRPVDVGPLVVRFPCLRDVIALDRLKQVDLVFLHVQRPPNRAMR